MSQALVGHAPDCRMPVGMDVTRDLNGLAMLSLIVRRDPAKYVEVHVAILYCPICGHKLAEKRKQ